MQLSDVLKRLQAEYPILSDQDTLRYSDEYALVETEQQKRTSIYGEKPDYALIIQNALLLLEQGSGQFFVVTALANALLQQYQWQGLVEGVELVHRSLQRPSIERDKTRIPLLVWLLERYSYYLETHPFTGLSKDFLKRAHAALHALEQASEKLFADQVNFHTVIRPFEGQQQHLKLEEEARTANQKLEEERRAAQLQELQQTLVQNTLDVPIDVDEHLALLRESPFEFSLYKFSRAEMWWRYPLTSSELFMLIDEQGLDWDAYASALKLNTQENYHEALLAFEALSHTHPYFLDLQWQICECLEALEADQAIIVMLKNECSELAKRYPELESAKIKEEYPVCSKQVKAYFQLF